MLAAPPSFLRATMATVDPIQALCGVLAQATGGAYVVDLHMPDGIHRLAEVVDLLFGKRIVAADVRERGRCSPLTQPPCMYRPP